MGTQQTKGRGPTRDGGGDRERLGLRVHAATDNRQERGPRGRRRHNTTTTTTKTASDMPTTNTGRPWQRRAGTLAANLDARLPALSTSTCCNANTACKRGIHPLAPSIPSFLRHRPGITIVQDIRHHHKPVRVWNPANRARARARAPIHPTSSPRTHPKFNASNLPKSGQKGGSRLERARRTTEAVTVDLFTTTTLPSSKQSGSPADRDAPIPFAHKMQEPIFPPTKPNPSSRPLTRPMIGDGPREVTPKQLHLFKKPPTSSPFATPWLWRRALIRSPPRGNYLMIR